MASDRDCQSDTKYLSISDIIDQMTKVKADDEEMKKKNMKPHYTPPGGWKEGSFKSLRLTKKVTFMPRENDRISRFHVLEPKWDRHQFLDPELEQAIHRLPCGDSSGTVIADFSREKNSRNLLAGKWCPADKTLRPLPKAPASLCALPFQENLLNKADISVNNLERQYLSMPSTTESQRLSKARIGSDLSNLKRTRDKIIEERKLDQNTKMLKSCRSTGQIMTLKGI
jgi:hypothetical protein